MVIDAEFQDKITSADHFWCRHLILTWCWRRNISRICHFLIRFVIFVDFERLYQSKQNFETNPLVLTIFYVDRYRSSTCCRHRNLSQICHFLVRVAILHWIHKIRLVILLWLVFSSQKWILLLRNDNSDLDLGADIKNCRHHSMRVEILLRLVSSSQKVKNNKSY